MQAIGGKTSRALYGLNGLCANALPVRSSG